MGREPIKIWIGEHPNKEDLVQNWGVNSQGGFDLERYEQWQRDPNHSWWWFTIVFLIDAGLEEPFSNHHQLWTFGAFTIHLLDVMTRNYHFWWLIFMLDWSTIEGQWSLIEGGIVMNWWSLMVWLITDWRLMMVNWWLISGYLKVNDGSLKVKLWFLDS